MNKIRRNLINIEGRVPILGGFLEKWYPLPANHETKAIGNFEKYSALFETI